MEKMGGAGLQGPPFLVQNECDSSPFTIAHNLLLTFC